MQLPKERRSSGYLGCKIIIQKKRGAHTERRDRDRRGGSQRAGPLGVSVRSPVLPGAREFVEAAEAAGIPRGDYNGRDRRQTLPPASSRTLSPRLPAGRLYRLPMDSSRFSAILPRATETCVLCRAGADGDIETYADMSRNGSRVAMAPSIAARFGCEQARQVLGVLKPQQTPFES